MNWIKPDWPAPDNVHAATTLRTGGASRAKFASLNPALHVNDDPDSVNLNRKALSTMLDLPSAPIWLEQVHGTRVIKAEQNNTVLQQADASYTDQSKTVCTILTADCLPILLCNSDGSKVAAIHAGWRGLLAGIISHTVKALNTSQLMAWLGPAIGPECFEIGSEVQTAFIEKSIKNAVAFKPTNPDKFLADIYQLARIELASLGIKQVYGGDFCTVTDKQRFYSYRRDGETGRMATLIWRD